MGRAFLAALWSVARQIEDIQVPGGEELDQSILNFPCFIPLLIVIGSCIQCPPDIEFRGLAVPAASSDEANENACRRPETALVCTDFRMASPKKFGCKMRAADLDS